MSYIRTESNPQYASIVQANDLVMVTTYNIELPSVREGAPGHPLLGAGAL